MQGNKWCKQHNEVDTWSNMSKHVNGQCAIGDKQSKAAKDRVHMDGHVDGIGKRYVHKGGLTKEATIDAE